MRRLVVALDIGEEACAKLVEGVEVPHIQGGHSMVFRRTEQAFDHLFEHLYKRSNDY